MANEGETRKTTKPYQLTFDHKPGYLHAVLTGPEDSIDISMQSWSEIARRCRERGYQKVLIEENLGTQLSLSEMYQVVSKLAKTDFFGIQVAYVDRKAVPNPDNAFGESVALNLGIKGKIFDKVGEAERWLIAQPPR